MGKNFNQWLNEFVNNGADAKDVTNWPEEAGGGTTVVANPELSGTEADLTGLQVGDSKYKVTQGPNIITVAYIDRLTDEQCFALRCGDIVIEDSDGQKPRPRFRYKQTFIVTRVNLVNSVGQKPTIILSYQQPNGSGSNAINCQSVVYQLDNEQWSCVANKFFDLQTSPDDVFLDGDSGNITLVDFQTIFDKGYCFIDYGVAIISGSTDYKGGPLPVLSTAVYQGKYYTVTFEPVVPQDPEGEGTFNYTVTEETVGGQPTINLTAGETLTQDQFFAIKQKDVKVVSDDIDLFLSQRDEENDYPILTSTVYDNKYLQVTFSENEMAEGANAPTYSVVVEEVSVGGSVNNVFTLTVQDFYSNESGTLSQENLEHLTQLLSTGDVTVEIRVPTEHPEYRGLYLTKSSYWKESGEIENIETYTFSAITGSDGVDCFSLTIRLNGGQWYYTRTNLKVAPE